MSPRIGIDARTLDDRFPGIARHLEGLLEGLAAAPGELEPVVFYDPRSERARVTVGAATRAIPGARAVPVRAPLPGVREQVALPWLARRLGLPLVHAPFLATPLAWPCRLTVTLHDAIPLDHPEAVRSPLRRLAWRALLELVTRRADAIVTVSEASRRRLLRHAPRLAARLTVVPNGVPARFRPAEDAAQDTLRRRLGCDRFALFLGAARRYRDLPVLLDAWAALQRSGRTHGHRLVLAGPSPVRALDLAAEVRRPRLRDVLLPGFVDDADLPALYSAATVLVHPSPAEGFALPVLEAMACGTPVLCPRGGASDEIAGTIGWRFEPGSAHELADALDVALRRTGGHREPALTRAAEFDCGRAAQRLIEVWCATLAHPRRSAHTTRTEELVQGPAR